MSGRQERQLVFSARDEGVFSMLDRLANSYENLSNTINKAFSTESDSSKKNIEAYEKQISLLEKKNKLESQSNRSSPSDSSNKFEPRNNAFTIDREKTKPSRNSLKDDDCCKTQIELLREIIETIKETSSDQIDHRSEMFEALRSEFNSSPPGTAPPTNTGRGGSSKGRGSGLDAGDVLQSLSGAGGIGALLKGAGPLAIVGAITAGLRKAFTNEMGREESLSQLSGVSGKSVFSLNNFEDDGYFGRGAVGRRDRTTYGFNEEQFMSRTVPTARAFGTSQNINNNILNAMALERGTGMDSSTILPMDRLSRVLSGSSNSTDITQKIFGSMSGSGAFAGGDLSRMNEIAETFTQFQEGQFLRSGNISNGASFLNLKRGLEGTGEAKFRRDDYAANTIGSINQGLITQGSPEAQAMKLDILRRANPKLGFFELQAEQEKGIGANGLLDGALSLAKSSGKDINQQAILFDQLTGGQLNSGDVLSLLKGDINTDSLGQSRDNGSRIDIEGRAENATSELRDTLESVSGEIQKFGQDILTSMRFMPNSGQMINLIGLIDQIKRELQ